MYNSYGYGYSPSISAAGGVWMLIAAVIAIIGGIVLYFTFLKKSNRGKFTGFLGGLYEFLHFRKMTIEAVLKITYLIGALMITLGSFGLIGQSFLGFLVVLVLGNVFLRLMYEFSMITIGIWRNTTDISNTLHGRKTNAPKTPADPAPVQQAAPPQQTAPLQDPVVKATAAPQEPAAPATKVCSTCGNVMEADAKFCRKCGSPFA